MKKLTSISPFLLLLVPVFVMMVISFTTNMQTTEQNDIALKSMQQSATAKTAVALNK